MDISHQILVHKIHHFVLHKPDNPSADTFDFGGKLRFLKLSIKKVYVPIFHGEQAASGIKAPEDLHSGVLEYKIPEGEALFFGPIRPSEQFAVLSERCGLAGGEDGSPPIRSLFFSALAADLHRVDLGAGSLCGALCRPGGLERPGEASLGRTRTGSHLDWLFGVVYKID